LVPTKDEQRTRFYVGLVPKATKVRRSKLPGYSISSSATANFRIATALLAV
jgi:hypothetical protein